MGSKVSKIELDANDPTPFHEAIEFGFKDKIIKLQKLFEGKQSSSGCSSLMVASRVGNLVLLKELKQKELMLQDVLGQTAFFKACMCGKPLSAKELVEEMDVFDKTGSTPLMAAAFAGCLELIDMVKHQSGQRDHLQRTALMKAAIFNRPEAVKKLMVLENEIGQVDEAGMSALGLAIARGFLDVVQILFEKEKSVMDQQLMCELAGKSGNRKMMEFLRGFGFVINEVDEEAEKEKVMQAKAQDLKDQQAKEEAQD